MTLSLDGKPVEDVDIRFVNGRPMIAIRDLGRVLPKQMIVRWAGRPRAVEINLCNTEVVKGEVKDESEDA